MKRIEHTDTIFTIEDFWPVSRCEEYISKTEELGYEAAKVFNGTSYQVMDTVRNNKRVMFKDYELAKEIWETLKQFAPRKVGNSEAVGLNELFRFYRYEPRQQFKKHRDMSYVRNAEEASYYTFMIYLNDAFTGGETLFNNGLAIKPRQGNALVFLHDLEHTGSEVTEGVKYVLRTDIMFRHNQEA